MSRDAREKVIPAPFLVAVGRYIQICVARAEACTLAAHEVSDPALKELLHDLAEERGLEAVALRAVAAPFGGASQSGTRMRHGHGPLARSDRSVLDDCIRGEQASVADFEATFTWAPPSAMPMEVRVLVLSAYSATLRALSALRRCVVTV
jgi:hypothetical protein